MAINLTALKSQLLSNIVGLTGATDEEVLLLSEAADNATVDRIMTVANEAALPDLTEGAFPSGQVFFVETLGVLVVSSGQKWVGFDSRILVDYQTYNNLFSWGRGLDGRLGDNTTVNKSSPVTVVGGITNWAQVSANFNHSLGVTTNGIAMVAATMRGTYFFSFAGLCMFIGSGSHSFSGPSCIQQQAP
jgi:hypothetical protein